MTERDDVVVTLRIPRVVLVAPLFGLLCVIPLGSAAPALAVLFVLPLLAVVYVLRVRTVADVDGVVAVEPFATTRVAWSDVAGVRFPRSPRLGLGGWARAVLTDGREVRLPAVSFNHLPALSLASGGRVPDPFAAEAAARAEAGQA